MTISLQKGGNISLTKTEPGLDKIYVGLGWDARATSGAAFDLDASIFLLTSNGTMRSDNDFIFYNNRVAQDGSVEHLGDNTTGIGDGDDEIIKVDLSKISPDVSRLVFAVSIYDAEGRKQNFGMVSSAYIRILNASTNNEISRYDLSEDSSLDTAMIFGEVYRHNNEWKFKAIGQGYLGGLQGLLNSFSRYNQAHTSATA
jgi:tellurium resistance protein TerD